VGGLSDSNSTDSLDRADIVIGDGTADGNASVELLGGKYRLHTYGLVEIVITPVEKLFEEDAANGTNVMTVDGSVTPVVFTIPSQANFDLFVGEIRFHGRDNGIKFGKFLGLNVELANGIDIDIKTDDTMNILPTIHSTDDFKARHSSVGGFDLDVQAGGDHFLAARTFGERTVPVIRATGTFGTDDYINITVNDDLTSVSDLYCTVFGFLRAV
jgi:hypothetical protein